MNSSSVRTLFKAAILPCIAAASFASTPVYAVAVTSSAPQVSTVPTKAKQQTVPVTRKLTMQPMLLNKPEGEIDATAVPEPGTLALFGLGLLGLGLARRRRAQ